MRAMLAGLAGFLRSPGKDVEAIKRSGAFATASYASKSRLPHGAAIAHYCAFGEAAGLLPNPFFDPSYFEKMSGTRSLAAYLSDQELFHLDPSPCFDARGYIERHSDRLATGENPLAHFWREGFDLGYRPSERFDMEYFRRAVARDRTDKRAALYDHMADYDDALPQNEAELASVQARFKAACETTCLKLTQTSDRRRDLVFAQAGRAWRPPPGLAERGIDVLANLYEDAPVPADVTHAFRQNGTKTTGISALLNADPSLFTGYDAVLFIDDDVGLDAVGIARLFEHRRQRGVDLLQASLSADSGCFFPALRQPLAGPALRSISAVEVMMPLLSRRAIERCGWVFDECVSGWMVDVLLSHQVRSAFGNTVAIAGDVVAVHRGFPDLTNGAYYRYLRRHGIVATHEAGAIAMKFGLNDKMSAFGYHVPDAFAAKTDTVDTAILSTATYDTAA